MSVPPPTMLMLRKKKTNNWELCSPLIFLFLLSWLLLFRARCNAAEENCFEFVTLRAQCVVGVLCFVFFLFLFFFFSSFSNAKWWTSLRLGVKCKGFHHPEKYLIGILCWLMIWPPHREINSSHLLNSLHPVCSSVL